MYHIGFKDNNSTDFVEKERYHALDTLWKHCIVSKELRWLFLSLVFIPLYATSPLGKSSVNEIRMRQLSLYPVRSCAVLRL